MKTASIVIFLIAMPSVFIPAFVSRQSWPLEKKHKVRGICHWIAEGLLLVAAALSFGIGPAIIWAIPLTVVFVFSFQKQTFCPRCTTLMNVPLFGSEVVTCSHCGALVSRTASGDYRLEGGTAVDAASVRNP